MLIAQERITPKKHTRNNLHWRDLADGVNFKVLCKARVSETLSHVRVKLLLIPLSADSFKPGARLTITAQLPPASSYLPHHSLSLLRDHSAEASVDSGIAAGGAARSGSSSSQHTFLDIHLHASAVRTIDD